jgi:hypothetical protein
MEPRRDHPLTEELLAATDVAALKDKLFFEKLSRYINELVINDFDYLLSLLYRIDVDEKKIRGLLATNKDANAGELIAHLIVERQEQKIRSREQFKPPTNIPEEEKW